LWAPIAARAVPTAPLMCGLSPAEDRLVLGESISAAAPLNTVISNS
jgi:hypothetical protein